MSSGNMGESGKALVGKSGKQVVSLLGHGRHRNVFLPQSAVLIPAAGTAR